MAIIPEKIKRAVRQQAGFGCCKCGLPIFEYHHIVRKSENSDEIMLLCPTCHHEATVNAMTKEEQCLHKKNPYNIKNGFAKGMLKVNQSEPIVLIGSTKFIGNGSIICIDNEPLVSLNIKEEQLLLSIDLYDQSDKIVAEIKNNEWVTGDPLPWDLEAGFQTLMIRKKSRDIFLQIDARNTPIRVRADIWKNQQNFNITPMQIFVNGSLLQANLVGGSMKGMCLNLDSAKNSFTIARKLIFQEEL